MFTTIQKWGNSQAIRIPKAILEMAKLSENDTVEIKVQDGNLLIVPIKKHKTLKDRIVEYKGDYKSSEWNTGKQKVERCFKCIFQSRVTLYF